LVGDRLIGDSKTGRTRPQPAGNSGFVVTLSEAVELSEVLARRVVASAVDDEGKLHPLPVWDKLADVNRAKSESQGPVVRKSFLASS
jgi:hypothetical protein